MKQEHVSSKVVPIHNYSAVFKEKLPIMQSKRNYS